MPTSTRTIYGSVSAHRQELMGFSALLILLFHEWVPVLQETAVLADVEHYLKLTGFFGVDIFFFLSGMGLYRSMEKDPNLLRFWSRRFGRIFLPYAAMAYLIGYSRGWSPVELLKALCGYSFYAKSIYTLLWFTPAIATVYLVYPLYYRLLRRSKKPTLFTAIVLALWLGLTFALRNVLRYDLFGFLGRLPMVILGAYFGRRGAQNPMTATNGRNRTFTSSPEKSLPAGTIPKNNSEGPDSPSDHLCLRKIQISCPSD